MADENAFASLFSGFANGVAEGMKEGREFRLKEAERNRNKELQDAQVANINANTELTKAKTRAELRSPGATAEGGFVQSGIKNVTIDPSEFVLDFPDLEERLKKTVPSLMSGISEEQAISEKAGLKNSLFDWGMQKMDSSGYRGLPTLAKTQAVQNMVTRLLANASGGKMDLKSVIPGKIAVPIETGFYNQPQLS